MEKPKDVTTASGERLELVCRACGYPIPTIIWSWHLGGIDHILFPTETVHSTNETNVVTSRLIYSRFTAQLGEYKCIAESRRFDGRFISIKSEAAHIRSTSMELFVLVIAWVELFVRLILVAYCGNCCLFAKCFNLHSCSLFVSWLR